MMFIDNLLSLFWCYVFFLFDIAVCCISFSSIFAGAVDLLGASRIVFEACVIFSTIFRHLLLLLVFESFFLRQFWMLMLLTFLCCQEAFVHTYFPNFYTYFLPMIKICSLWDEFDLCSIQCLIIHPNNHI